MRRRCTASLMMARSSGTPLTTAENAMNAAFVFLAMTWANVVFPEPGGPHRMNDGTRSASMASRSD